MLPTMGTPLDEANATKVPASHRTRRGGAGDRPSERRTANTLLLAAERLAQASPTAGTVQDVLEGRVLGHYAQGLQQYLAIRLGSTEAAQRVFALLKDRVAALGINKLMQPPGVRARLFRLARALADEDEGRRAKGGTLLWMKPSRPEFDKGLTAIRQAPSAGDRELLELRYARELDTEEIAFVLDLDISEAERRLEGARSEARRLFELGKDSDLPRALLEAFALEKIQAEASGSQDEPMLPTGTVLDGRYRLEQHIGSGAFADVYKATDVVVPGHVVALKVLKRKATSGRAREQALRELRLIASVFHPSIVQFKDHGYHDDRFWFVMPWYEGESLEARMARGPLSRLEARRIFVPLAKALATMHAAKLRHQDIKPDNIFLAKIEGFGDQQDVLPVLLDLGVAAQDAELLLAGTPTYFAPEVAAQFSYREGDPFPVHPIGPASDVFSLALSLRNALEPSTQPDVAAGAVDSFIRERAQSIPELPTSKDLRYLHKHFRRWMALDPAERPTADEFASELAVLTAPEERRERRMRQLRTVVPIVTVLFSVVGWGAYRLIEDARIHAEKAEAAAQQREAAMESAVQEREQLEQQIARAQQNIQASQLSRAELEDQLATAQGNLSVARRTLTRLRRREREKAKQIDGLTTELEDVRSRLTQIGERLAAAEGQLQRRTEQLAEARRQVEELSARQARLEERLRAAEQARAEAQGELERAQAQVSELQRERDRAEAGQRRSAEQAQRTAAELARVRAELSSTQATLRALRRQPGPSLPPGAGSPPPVPNPAPTPGPAPTVMVRRR